MSIFARFRNWLLGRSAPAAIELPRREPAVAPAKAPAKRIGAVTAAMLHELLGLLKAGRPEQLLPNRNRSLRLPEAAPGVVPKGAPTMAQDSQIGACNRFGEAAEWDGQGFMGYALLAELAQIPEFRRPSEILANEMTRKWVKLISVGKEDKTEKLKVLEDEMKRLGVQEAFRKAFEVDNQQGRSHIAIVLKGVEGDGLKKPLVLDANVEKDSLEAIRVIEPIWTYPNSYNSVNPLAADFYRPQVWYVLSQEIHTSRLLTFVSRPVSDILKPAYMFGGVSLTQLLRTYVDNWLRTRQSVSDITHNFSTPVFKTDLGQLMQPGGAANLFARINVFNTARDNQGAMVVDFEKEDFVNVSAPLGGLDKLQAQAQEQMAAIAGIPLVKYFGITPSGLNASSDGEMRAFYDTIESVQERIGTPELRLLLDVIQMSKFGAVDPDIGFIWMPLWSLDEKGLAEVRKINAETDSAYVDHGIIDPAEVRQTVAAEENSRYASIDVEDMPEPPEQEGGGEEDDDEAVPDAPDAPDARLRNAGEGKKKGRGGEDARRPFAIDAEFTEADHPRDSDGKFGSGGGSSGTGGGKPAVAAKVAAPKGISSENLSKAIEKRGIDRAAKTALQSISTVSKQRAKISAAYAHMGKLYDRIGDIVGTFDTPDKITDIEDLANSTSLDAIEEGAKSVYSGKVKSSVDVDEDDIKNLENDKDRQEFYVLKSRLDALYPKVQEMARQIRLEALNARKAIKGVSRGVDKLWNDPNLDEDDARNALGDHLAEAENWVDLELDAAADNLALVAGEEISEELAGELEGQQETIDEEKADEERWDALSEEEQEAELAAQREKARLDLALQDYGRTLTINKALADGWKPQFNEHGNLTNTPESVRGVASSPTGVRKLYRHLNESGVEIPEAGKRLLATDASWKESDHPRAPDGKFGAGSGGSSSEPSKPSAPYKPGLHAAGVAPADEKKKEWRETAPQTLEQLIQASPINQAALVKACDQIAATVKAKFKNPGPKSKERLEQKVQRGKAPKRITDGVRGGFDVETPEQADAIVKSLSKSFEVADEGWTRLKTGYFDRKAMVRFPDGQVGEVQLWPPGMLQAKSGEAHKLYEQWQSLEPNSPDEVELKQRMVDHFAKVERALPPAWKKLFQP